ncbi:MAG: hypothetical protein OEM59_11345 [Rhodospirillales bacterium]|nr:hypothetical protein [Rhodospirillales bacterium]
MTAWLPRHLVLLICGGLLAACAEFGPDVDKVKAAETMGQPNDQLVKDIAGARGTFKWSGRRSEKYGKSSGIILVEARIERTNRAGNDQVVQLQWLHNRKTGVVDFEDVLINGQSRGILGAALEMLLLDLEVN